MPHLIGEYIMNTLTTVAQSITSINGVEVTVIETKKGGWTSVQFANGVMKNVRTKDLTIGEVNMNNNFGYSDSTNLLTGASNMNSTNVFANFVETDVDLDLKEALWIEELIQSVDGENKSKEAAELKRATQTAITAVRAFRLYELAIASGYNTLAHQVLRSVLEFTKYWKNKYDTKTTTRPLTVVSNTQEYREGRKTREAYYRDSLVYIASQSAKDISEVLEIFDKGVTTILNQFRVTTDEELDKMSGSISKRNYTLTYVPPVADEVVQLRITANALLMSVKRGTVFTVGNLSVSMKRDQRYSITVADMTNNVFPALARVNIHAKVDQLDGHGRSYQVISESISEVKGSLLNKLFLLKMNRIAIDKLFTSDTKRKVISIAPNGKLEDVSYPSREVRGVYLNTGLVSTSEAAAGYVDATRDVNGLIQFVGNGITKVALTVNQVNKTISRNDKQEKTTWAIGTHRVFVLADVTSAENFNDFGAGTFLVNEAFMNKYGLCRVTSRMAQGGVKAVTNYADCNKNGPLILSPNAFKGGIVSALMLRGAKIETLSKLVTLDTDRYVKHFENTLETIEFNGRELKGFYVDVELNISNAYLVEQYKIRGEELEVDVVDALIASAEDVIEHTNKMPSALRNMVMYRLVNEPDFEVVPFLQAMVEAGNIVAKAPVTRHTASVFQSIAQWHGQEEAQLLIDSLIKRLPVSARIPKQLAAQYVMNTFNVVKTVAVQDILEIMISESEANRSPLLDNVDTYPLETKGRLFNLFGYEEDAPQVAKFYNITFGSKSVMVPATTNSFYVAERETLRTFLATGFLKDVMSFAKACTEVTEAGDTFTTPNSFAGEGAKLEAIVQGRLLGKNFGYIETKGTYQVMLNLVGANIARDEVRVTDLNMFREANEVNAQALEVNGCKHPAYFKDAAAGYAMVQHAFQSDIANFAMSKAAFMSVYTIMILENDIDGDTQQFSRDGHRLPLFKGPSAEFNGIEFTNFLNEEQKDARLVGKSVKVLQSTMPELHDALYAAASAKSNIGMFTAVKYKYEAVLQGVESFVGTDGNTYDMDADTRYMITNTLSRLCQTEAMDNVKQVGVDGREAFIMELVAPHNFTGMFLKSGETEEEVRAERMKAIVARLNTNVFPNWNVPADFATVMVEALAHAAILMKSKGHVALDIFSNRTAVKRFNEVVNNLAEGTDNNTFDMKGSLSVLSESSDSASLYAYLAYSLATV